MTTLRNNKILYWLTLVLTWWAAIFLFGLIRHYGWPDRLPFSPEYLIEPWLDLSLALVVGTGYFFIELLMNRPYFRRWRFLAWAGLKSLLNLVLVIILIGAGSLLYPYFNETVVEEVRFGRLLVSKLMLVVLVYFTVVTLVITLFERMHQKLGPGILGNLLAGRYHQPREEERIFLFIDLQDSTPMAEQLGHIRFSSLIQDCFADITDSVVRHDAEIYQYVGDEVILCWKSAAGLRNANCIAAFFDFERTLHNRGLHYHSTYGLKPVFKAAAHVGPMTVAEVGIVKREIAYHGDVLNTTARIQSKCNDLGERLLISPDLAERLQLGKDHVLKEYPPVELTGKRFSLPVLGVRRRGKQD